MRFRTDKGASLLASALIAATLWFAVQPAQASQSAMFILDASGSMWGRIEPQLTKIEAARDTMSTLLSEVPDSLEVGLVAYGHRRKGDCGDIEVIPPPGVQAGRKIASRLPGLTPRGKTPISDALVIGTEKLAFRDGKKSVVLVSDGIETCSADPCAVAETLAAANIDLSIHVVGFDVDAEARAQLQCIAEKGRGEYFTADSVFELSDALSTVTTALAASLDVPPPPPPPPPPTVAAPQTDGAASQVKIVRIKTVGTVELAPASWVESPRYWRLIDPETGDVAVKTNKGEAKVRPGTYQLAWRQIEHGASDVELSTIVTVEGGQTSIAPVDTGMRLTLPEGMQDIRHWELLDGEGKRVVRYSILDPVPVPAGRYTLVLRQSEHGHKDSHLGEIEIEAGKLNDVIADQGVDIQWPTEWTRDDKEDWVFFVKLQGSDEALPFKANYRGPVIVAPGTYKMSLRLRQHGWSEVDWGIIEVPESGFVSPGFNSGITFVSDEAEPRHLITAENLDTGATASINNHWGPFPLPPGRYRFDYKREREQPITIIDELEIEAGTMIEAQM